MTYLDYIVQFQRLRRQQPFPSTSADLYYHLLWIANGLGWKNPFNEGSSILMASLSMTDKTLTSARDKLIDAGLIKYLAGKKGTFSTYELLTIPQNNTENFRSIRGQSGGETGGNRGEKPGTIRGESGGLHKSKIKSKKKESNDSKSAQKRETLPTVADPPPPEPWAAWLAENAPDVQLMKQPLTAAQWGQLVKDFGAPTVQEVLLAMHNTTGAEKKYKSANLTARNWCQRRAGNKEPRPQPLPQPVGPAPATVPTLNTEVVAERQRQREAEAAANRQRIRAAAQAS